MFVWFRKRKFYLCARILKTTFLKVMISRIKSAYTRFFTYSLALLFALASTTTQAQDGHNAIQELDNGTAKTHEAEGEHDVTKGEHSAAEKFDAGKMILEHISDAHSWHLWGHTAIPLPVIVYNKDRGGLKIFSSSHFDHGHSAYEGYMEKEGKLVAVDSEGKEDEAANANLWDFSITKNVMSLLVGLLILTWIIFSIAGAYKRRAGLAPKGMQSLIEPIIIFIRDDVAKASIGEKKYMKYLPYLLTLFFFIWINNLLGLVPIFPGGANLTGNVAITMTLALITFFIVSFSANKNYWHHIFAMPGVPKWVLFLLTPIEILGVFLRPFVLLVRLFANITAGHIIALSFFALIFIFGEMNVGLGYGVSIVSLAFTVFMTCLELLVAFLQAYVFTLLTAIYIGAAVEEAHHDSHSHDAHVEEAAII